MKESLGRYITRQRLLLACGKLANSSEQVQNIAETAGFASIYAFAHFFKKNTGMSPLEYRKAARNDRPDVIDD